MNKLYTVKFATYGNWSAYDDEEEKEVREWTLIAERRDEAIFRAAETYGRQSAGGWGFNGKLEILDVKCIPTKDHKDYIVVKDIYRSRTVSVWCYPGQWVKDMELVNDPVLVSDDDMKGFVGAMLLTDFYKLRDRRRAEAEEKRKLEAEREIRLEKNRLKREAKKARMIEDALQKQKLEDRPLTEAEKANWGISI